jgi:hypothetical protein
MNLETDYILHWIWMQMFLQNTANCKKKTAACHNPDDLTTKTGPQQKPQISQILKQTSSLVWEIFDFHDVGWVPCHHDMAHPKVADGGDALQLCTVAVNILNKQSRTADKAWSSSLGVGRGANNSSP